MLSEQASVRFRTLSIESPVILPSACEAQRRSRLFLSGERVNPTLPAGQDPNNEESSVLPIRD